MSTQASPPDRDFLAGVSEQTSKAELIQRLRDATEWNRKVTVERADRLVEIENRVREKWSGLNADPLLQIIVQGTEAELTEAVEFMADLEGFLPATLQRVLTGARTLMEQSGS